MGCKTRFNWWMLNFHLGTGQINMDSNLLLRRYLKAKTVTENKTVWICTVIKQCETKCLRRQRVLSPAPLCLHSLHAMGSHAAVRSGAPQARFPSRPSWGDNWCNLETKTEPLNSLAKIISLQLTEGGCCPLGCPSSALLLTAEDDCMGISEKVPQAKGGRRNT